MASKLLQVRIPEDVYTQLELSASTAGVSLADFIRETLAGLYTSSVSVDVVVDSGGVVDSSRVSLAERLARVVNSLPPKHVMGIVDGRLQGSFPRRTGELTRWVVEGDRPSPREAVAMLTGSFRPEGEADCQLGWCQLHPFEVQPNGFLRCRVCSSPLVPGRPLPGTEPLPPYQRKETVG